VGEGEIFNDRYRIKAIGTDVVEIEEAATGTLTKLAIR
jgi:hypothetical protein